MSSSFRVETVVVLQPLRTLYCSEESAVVAVTEVL